MAALLKSCTLVILLRAMTLGGKVCTQCPSYRLQVRVRDLLAFVGGGDGN